jgi:hypothetical protein
MMCAFGVVVSLTLLAQSEFCASPHALQTPTNLKRSSAAGISDAQRTMLHFCWSCWLEPNTLLQVRDTELLCGGASRVLVAST